MARVHARSGQHHRWPQVSARAEFLAALRAGLRGCPELAIDEVVAEYDTHFAEGKAANRSEQDIAAALGDPWALAQELRVELHIARWEAAPSPRSGAQVVASVIALGVLNAALSVLVLPLLLLITLAVIVAIAACVGGGIWMLFAGPSLEIPGGAGVTVLSAMGLIFAALSLTALAALCGQLLANALARWVRLHYQVLPRANRAGTP
jgi:uncharacterized membrane protein